MNLIIWNSFYYFLNNIYLHHDEKCLFYKKFAVGVKLVSDNSLTYIFIVLWWCIALRFIYNNKFVNTKEDSKIVTKPSFWHICWVIGDVDSEIICE